MKKAVMIIGAILFSCSLVVSGQITGSVGVKGGISLANQSHQFTPIEYTLETDPILGPGIAVFVEAFRKEHISVQLDLSYITKGSKSTIESITVNHLDNDRVIVNEGDLWVSKFNYLSISPVARYRIGGELFIPYLFLGPRLDILLWYDTDSEYPLDEQNIFIPGLSLGAGLEYSLNRTGLFAEVQYQGDVIPVTGIDPLLINNHVVLITLGIRYLNVP